MGSGVGLEEALRIRRFEHLPSPEDFSSQIEPTNVPAVFTGAVKDWKALSKWNPSHGGLDYLQEQVGSAIVEAMLSKSAPVFYGDLRSHERIPLPFSTFITSCKLHLRNMGTVSGCFFVQEESEVAPANSEEVCSTSLHTPDKVYLAQVPILNFENKERSQLQTLQEDIQTPTFLEMKPIASINLWMNRARSRSSTHYDPHHNLLCVVAGCKQVVLWPPSASPFLYPMPVYGEASNHSAVDLENPDLSVHLRAKHSVEYSQKVILRSGDALFIPEGWFHQVDSDDLTIAVNFWWKSNMMSNMLEHMDSYYLRRILNRFRSCIWCMSHSKKPLDCHEQNQMLHKGPVCSLKGRENSDEAPEGDHEFQPGDQRANAKESSGKHDLALNQLEPLTLHVLHELIALVHETVNVSAPNKAVQSTSSKESEVNPKDEHKQTETDNLYFRENDPVAGIFWTLEPLVLQKVLLAMVHHFPRTLEALILHMLSPTGAEVLTRKFDEMDQQTTKEKQSEFYQLFYSVFDDQYAAMDAILKGKEFFAFQAFRNVLDHYLGAKTDKP